MASIPLSVPNLKGNEASYVQKAIKSEWVSTGGSFIVEFEDRLKTYVKSKFAVACQSGTAALHLALISCGVGSGDEVIVPALTFIAAVNPVKYVGAEPVFMDCDDTLCMDMDKLEEFFQHNCDFVNGTLFNRMTKKPIAAVLPVHVFGNIANMEKLMMLKEKYGFLVIEDATEALGSYISEGKYIGQFAGTIGDVGAYSFNGNKLITTGGGGMLVANTESIASQARHLSTQAKNDVVYFIHDSIGYNYRMTNVQAALGVAQMEQIEDFISVKQRNYLIYKNNGLNLLSFRSDTRANYWFYSYITEYRDELIRYLDKNGIQSRPIWHLINTLVPYQNNQSYDVVLAKDYWMKIVNIPCSSSLSEQDAAYVSKAIKQFEKEHGK